MSPFEVHKSWFIRAALVLLVTVLADGVAVWYSHRPLLWATLIAATLPVSMIVFVVIPMLRQESRKS